MASTASRDSEVAEAPESRDPPRSPDTDIEGEIDTILALETVTAADLRKLYEKLRTYVETLHERLHVDVSESVIERCLAAFDELLTEKEADIDQAVDQLRALIESTRGRVSVLERSVPALPRETRRLNDPGNVQDDAPARPSATQLASLRTIARDLSELSERANRLSPPSSVAGRTMTLRDEVPKEHPRSDGLSDACWRRAMKTTGPDAPRQADGASMRPAPEKRDPDSVGRESQEREEPTRGDRYRRYREDYSRNDLPTDLDALLRADERRDKYEQRFGEPAERPAEQGRRRETECADRIETRYTDDRGRNDYRPHDYRQDDRDRHGNYYEPYERYGPPGPRLRTSDRANRTPHIASDVYDTDRELLGYRPRFEKEPMPPPYEAATYPRNPLHPAGSYGYPADRALAGPTLNWGPPHPGISESATLLEPFADVTSYRAYRLADTTPGPVPTSVLAKVGKYAGAVKGLIRESLSFDGREPIKLLAFLTDVKRGFDGTGISEGLGVHVVQYFLEGDAARFYRTVTASG